jgi:hypothetical protein
MSYTGHLELPKNSSGGNHQTGNLLGVLFVIYPIDHEHGLITIL